MVNLKSASFVVIMLLHKGDLDHSHPPTGSPSMLKRTVLWTSHKYPLQYYQTTEQLRFPGFDIISTYFYKIDFWGFFPPVNVAYKDFC